MDQTSEELTAGTVSKLLKLTYSGDNKNFQKEAEKRLALFEGRSNFVSCLQQIICDGKQADNVRSSAALYLLKYSKGVMLDGKNPIGLILLLVQLLESPIEMSLKRHVGNALKAILSHSAQIRMELLHRTAEKIPQLLVTQTNQCEAILLIGHDLIVTAGQSNQERQAVFLLIGRIIQLGLKIVDENNIVQLKKLYVLREVARFVKSAIKLVNQEQGAEYASIFNLPVLDRLLKMLLLFNKDLYQTEDKKQSIISNEMKTIVISSLDILLKKVLKLVKDGRVSSTDALIVNNLPQFLQFLLQQSIKHINQNKFYEEDSNATTLLQTTLKFTTTCLKEPTMEKFFSQCRQQLLFSLIFPLFQLSEELLGSYEEEPEDFVNTIMAIAEGQEQQLHEDDILHLQITNSKLLCVFCTQQHGILLQLIQFILLKINQVQGTEEYILLMLLATLRDCTKERTEIHRVLKDYLDSKIAIILSDRDGVTRCLYLYLINRYMMFISTVDEVFLRSAATTALTIIQTEKLRKDECLAIVAMEILANTCAIGEIVMKNTALDTFIALIPLIHQPMSHRIFDTILQIVQGYAQKITDEAILACVHQLVMKIQSETLSRKPPIISNKCWNIIRQIGNTDFFIPRLVIPIENEILTLQKYLQKPEEVQFQEDFLLLCTAFIKKTKKITPNQLALFQSFSKIFQRYGYTFGHMFQTLSYIIYYGSDILKASPKAVDFIIQICLKGLNGSPKSNEADQCQGVLLLQSLIMLTFQAFTQQSVVNCIEMLRQKNCKNQFLKSNIYCAITLFLSKLWSTLSKDHAQLLLTIVLSSPSSFNDQHSIKLHCLSLCQILKIHHPVIASKAGIILSHIIRHFNQSLAVFKLENNTIQSKQYDIALQSYMDPIKQFNEYDNFKRTFEEMQRTQPQMMQLAVAQLSQQETEYLKGMMRMQRVGNEVRVKLTVKKP